MTPSAARPQLRGRAQFLLLGTLFAAPLFAAVLLYFYFPQSRPAGRTNYGELLRPARPLPPLELIEADGNSADPALLKRKWTLLIRSDGDCDDACLRHLILTRQTRLALNEKRLRVQRVLLLSDAGKLAEVSERLAAEHPDLKVIADGNGAANRFFGSEESLADLLDPLGNWLMRYPPGGDTQTDFKGLQKDIRKLLRVSQIG